MSLFRPAAALFAAVLVAGTATSGPASAAAPEPTTLSVDGTVRVTVLDDFGDDGEAEYRHAIETDDGSRIPVDLPDAAPADARFDGELVVRGDVAADLAAEDLLPRAGTTIAEGTRAGRLAVASAEQQPAPLRVAESTIAPVVSAAVVAPTTHRAYVAKMTDQGSVEGTDAAIGAKVDSVLDYWRSESGGAISSFTRQGAIESFDSTADIPPSQGCGMKAPDAVWTQAARLFPRVNFDAPGNHLIVLVGDECAAGGPVGVAAVGSSIADGGPSIVTYDQSIFASTGAHELGHNFGLEHANLLSPNDYLDLYSPMGFSISGSTVFTPPSLGTLHRRQLGVLAAGEIATATATPGPQTFSIGPRSGTSGTRGVLATDPASGATYSIDLRSRTGRDASAFYGSGGRLGTPVTYPSGVVVERQDANRQTYVVAAPGTNAGAYAAGQVFAPSAGLRVTVNAVSSSAATVTVETGPVLAPAPAPAPEPAPPAAPQQLTTKKPTIRGTVRIGRTLKVKVGSWSPRPSYRYQWYANGKKITKKGTKSSFKLTSKQKGKRITVRVTARKSGYATVSRTSAKTKKVAKR